MVRVLVVDDHRIFRLSLARRLAGDGRIAVVGEAESVAAAELELGRVQPDVALVDVRLGGGNGLTLAAAGRVLSPATQFVAISAGMDADLAHQAHAAGCAAAVGKSASMDELGDLLVQVHRAAGGPAAPARPPTV